MEKLSISIEQKAKAYDEALELAKDYFKANQRLGELEENDMLSDIFPELKESEDERTRRNIIRYLKKTSPAIGENIEKMLAWLEKQGKVYSDYENNEMKRGLLWHLKELRDMKKTKGLPIKSKATYNDWIAWLEKQGEFYTKRDVDNAYIEGMAFAKDELEKQGEQKGYTFKSIPRLLDMIEPSDKANAYCQKLIDALAKEGYNTDAKIVEEVLKGWNGEDVPMAVMDEQKPFDYENANIQQTDFAPKVDMPRYSIGDVLCDKSCTTLDKEAQPNFEIIDIRNGMYICDKCSFPISQQDEYELVAKKIEQKPTDKVKPKFKVGDWVVQENIGVYKVIEVCESWYEVIDGEDNHYSISFDNEYMCHLWDITKDAKDGDVLATKNDVFIFKHIDKTGLSLCKSYCEVIGNSGLGFGFEFSINSVYPATKEQRDLLFQKMHEAGYEWDAEKKEAKKIEQKPTDEDMKEALRTEYEKGRADAIAEMQKPAWSEDDEEFLRRAINATKDDYPMTAKWLKFLKDRVQPKQEWSKKDNQYLCGLIGLIEQSKAELPITLKGKAADNCIDWLKSLKKRYTWKPSDEQMEVLLSEVSAWTKGCPKQIVLESLYNDLKKLTEE